MTSRLRKFGLAVHLIVSVGWVGAVAAFLLLALSALTSDGPTSRAAYIAMEVVGRGALLPLSVGALTSGIVQSLGTKWGLFKHYWVLVKLVLTVFATAALFLHQFTAVTEAARLASQAVVSQTSLPLRQLGLQLRADAGLALLVLVTITAIAVYKPWGLIGNVSRSLRLFLAAITALLVAFVALHLSGRSPHQHSH
ncbi:MAG TPA: hypothetical protein VHB79_06160 [Polyangiaceae bacterium]|nr:hypothetical protein [Polyangiaceae bacterium]